MARIRQTCGATGTSTKTVPCGGSCRESLSATSMTVAIELGGSAMLSKEIKLTCEVFCLVLGLDLHNMAEESRHGEGDESR